MEYKFLPKDNGTGEARQIAEKVMGKSLPSYAEVHHIDGDQSNKNNSNLVVCEDHTYHMLLHKRTRAFIACGNAKWRRCSYCGEYDDPKNLYINLRSTVCYHRKCYTQWQQTYRDKKRKETIKINYS